MKSWIWISLFTLLFFSITTYSQDYTKLTQLQAKMQKLAMQLANSKSQSEADAIQNQINALTKEMLLEAQKIEHEGFGAEGDAPTTLLSQDEFTKKTLKDLDKAINSLPPALQEIYFLERKLDDLEPVTDAEKINDISDQIMGKMDLIYSGTTPLETDATSFITSVKFCKKGTVTCEVEGAATNNDTYDLKYKMVINGEITWVADYVVDIIQKKGYLIAYTIDTHVSETEPIKVNFPKLSGTKMVMRMGQIPTKGPIDKFKSLPDVGLFQIGPVDLKNFDLTDVRNWPDEMVNTYELSLVPPSIFFYSSMDDLELKPFIPYPVFKISEAITPSEINQGIQKGEYKKTIVVNDPPGDALKTTLTVHLLFQPLICNEKGNPGAMAVSGACIDHGGYIMATEDKVFVNGKPVARVGDKVLCFRHGVTEIVGDKDVKVYSNKERVARVGDKTKCGAVITGGLVNIYAGEKGK